MVETFLAGSSPSEMADCTNRRGHIAACGSSRLCGRLVRTSRRRLNCRSKLKANKAEAQLQSSTKMFCWTQSGPFVSASPHVAAERWSTKPGAVDVLETWYTCVRWCNCVAEDSWKDSFDLNVKLADYTLLRMGRLKERRDQHFKLQTSFSHLEFWINKN